jgi:hypothetical protein
MLHLKRRVRWNQKGDLPCCQGKRPVPTGARSRAAAQLALT